MDDCIEYQGRPSFYQNEALERFIHVWQEPVYQFSWVETICEKPCLRVSHMEIRHPVKLDYPRNVCVYCGEPGYTVDHVLPVSWTGRAARSMVYTVPSCGQCNSAIGDHYAPSISERRRMAQKYIAKKYASDLRMKEFSDEELDEFGPAMRSTIIAGIARKRSVEFRLSWPPLGFDERALEGSGIDAYTSGLIHAM